MYVDPGYRERATDLGRINQYELQNFPIEDGKKHPYVILLAGGAYARVATGSEALPLIPELHEAGFSVFVLYYRVAELAHFPNPQDDLARAVQYTFDNAERLDLDTDHYFILGYSAGGHLTASFGSEAIGWKKYGLKRPTALMLCYPVISLRACLGDETPTYHIGENPDEELIHLTSVDEQVTSEYPPVFLWRAAGDVSVGPEHKTLLKEALLKNKVPYEEHEYPLSGHGQGRGLGTACEDWLPTAIQYMKTYL